MDFSIVITTYNRVDVLKNLLLSLENQTDNDFEVVVAIDGSTDGTEAMLGGLSVPYSLKWINTRLKSYGLAVARNQGILASSGKIVAILDDDSFPEPEFVAAHKESARHHTITGGPRTPADAADGRQAWKMRELGKLPHCKPVTFEQLRNEWPTAVYTECNICLYKQDLLDMGLFSERIKMYGYIGQEFFARAEYLRYFYQYNPRADMRHHRQPEGDNGLYEKKKRIETRVAAALRPSFMKPSQYRAQIEWAKCISENPLQSSELPPFPISTVFAFPYRFVRGIAKDSRRFLRDQWK